jgi:ribosomal protein L37E
MKAYYEDKIEYCPECGWNMYKIFVPGNNGFMEKYYCSFCGYKEP